MKGKINFDTANKALNNASLGVAVAAAFLNVALLVVKIVKTVSEDTPETESGAREE